MKRLLIFIVKSALKLATCRQEEKNSPIAYSSQTAILILVIYLMNPTNQVRSEKIAFIFEFKKD